MPAAPREDSVDPRREVYGNPLYSHAATGAIRVLKRLSVEAMDADLAQMVKQVEDHIRESSEG